MPNISLKFGSMVIILFSLLQLRNAHAQQKTDLLRNYPFIQIFDRESGLPTESVRSVNTDSKGFIWIGTSDGLFRYDGKKMRRFGKQEGLPSNSIIQFQIDQEDRVWIFHLNGFGYLKNEKWYPYLDKVSSLNPSAKTVYGSCISDIGFLGMFTHDTLYLDSSLKLQFEKVAVEYVPFNSSVSMNPELTFDGENIFIRQYPKNHPLQIDKIGQVQDIPIYRTLSHHKVLVSRLDDSLTLLIRNGDLYEFDQDTIHHLYTIEEQSSAKITFTDILGMDSSYLCLTNEGLGLLDREMKEYYTNPYFPQGGYGYSCKDGFGNLWIAHWKYGLFKVPARFTERLKWDNHILFSTLSFEAVATYGKFIFAGDSRGVLYRISNDKIDSVQIPMDIQRAAKFRKIIPLDIDRILFYGDYGVYGYNFHKKQFFNEFQLDRGHVRLDIAPRNRSVHLLEFMSEGYFIGHSTDQYYNEWDNEGKPSLSHSERSYYQHRISNNEILFKSSLTDSIKLFSEKGVKPFNHPQKKLWHQSLSSIQINDSCFLLNHDSLGAIIVSGDSVYFPDALASMFVKKLMKHQNHFYGITQNGVLRMHIENYHPFNISVRHFTPKQGLVHPDISDFGFTDEYILIATKNGIQRLQLTDFDFPDEIPKIYLEGLFINDSLRDQFEDIVLQPNERNLQLNLGAIYFSGQDQLSYQFKLKGFDQQFRKSINGQVSYTNIPHGSYEFVAEAHHRENRVNSEPIQLSITVLPAFYEKLWFKALIGLVILLVFVVVLAWQTNRVRERERQKNILRLRMAEYELKALQSQMNPHFVSNALNSIQRFLLKNDPDQASYYLSQFSKLMRLVLESSLENLIPLEDEIELIQNYILLENLRFQHKINCKLVVDEELSPEEILFPSLILQPYVENCFKHAFPPENEKPSLLVHFQSISASQIRVRIEDNGVAPFQKATGDSTHISRGRQLVKDKLDLLKIKYNIDVDIQYLQADNPTEFNGTTVIIDVVYAERTY